MSDETANRDVLSIDPTAYGVFVSAAPEQVARTFRDGDNLVIELVDGSQLVLHRYFALVYPPAVLTRDIATNEVLVLKVAEDGEYIGAEPARGVPIEETLSIVEDPSDEQEAGRAPYLFQSSGEWLAGIMFAGIAASFVLRDDDKDEGNGAGTPTSAGLDANGAGSPELAQELLAMGDAPAAARSAETESASGELTEEDLQMLAECVNDCAQNADSGGGIAMTAAVDGDNVALNIEVDGDRSTDKMVEVELELLGQIMEWAYGDASAI